MKITDAVRNIRMKVFKISLSSFFVSAMKNAAKGKIYASR